MLDLRPGEKIGPEKLTYLLHKRDKIRLYSQRVAVLQAEQMRLVEELRAACPHLSVVRESGEMWADWPEWGYAPDEYVCLDCSQRAYSNQALPSGWQFGASWIQKAPSMDDCLKVTARLGEKGKK